MWCDDDDDDGKIDLRDAVRVCFQRERESMAQQVVIIRSHCTRWNSIFSGQISDDLLNIH